MGALPVPEAYPLIVRAAPAQIHVPGVRDWAGSTTPGPPPTAGIRRTLGNRAEAIDAVLVATDREVLATDAERGTSRAGARDRRPPDRLAADGWFAGARGVGPTRGGVFRSDGGRRSPRQLIIGLAGRPTMAVAASSRSGMSCGQAPAERGVALGDAGKSWGSNQRPEDAALVVGMVLREETGDPHVRRISV